MRQRFHGSCHLLDTPHTSHPDRTPWRPWEAKLQLLWQLTPFEGAPILVPKPDTRSSAQGPHEPRLAQPSEVPPKTQKESEVGGTHQNGAFSQAGTCPRCRPLVGSSPKPQWVLGSARSCTRLQAKLGSPHTLPLSMF